MITTIRGKSTSQPRPAAGESPLPAHERAVRNCLVQAVAQMEQAAKLTSSPRLAAEIEKLGLAFLDVMLRQARRGAVATAGGEW